VNWTQFLILNMNEYMFGIVAVIENVTGYTDKCEIHCLTIY
jgi:hypothetical protein